MRIVHHSRFLAFVAGFICILLACPPVGRTYYSDRRHVVVLFRSLEGFSKSEQEQLRASLLASVAEDADDKSMVTVLDAPPHLELQDLLLLSRKSEGLVAALLDAKRPSSSVKDSRQISATLSIFERKSSLAALESEEGKVKPPVVLSYPVVTPSKSESELDSWSRPFILETSFADFGNAVSVLANWLAPSLRNLFLGMMPVDLVVRTRPGDVDLYLNEVLLGTTAKNGFWMDKFFRSPGNYILTAKRYDYFDDSKSIAVLSSDRTSVNFTFTLKKRSKIVKSEKNRTGH